MTDCHPVYLNQSQPPKRLAYAFFYVYLLISRDFLFEGLSRITERGCHRYSGVCLLSLDYNQTDDLTSSAVTSQLPFNY
jgi:hypothetical protein